MYMYHAVFFDRFSRFPFQKESRAYATAGSRRFILRPLSNQAKSQMPPLLLVIQPIRTGDSGEKTEKRAHGTVQAGGAPPIRRASQRVWPSSPGFLSREKTPANQRTFTGETRGRRR
jgi:hypothetical protein